VEGGDTGSLGIKQLLVREMIKESNFVFTDWYRANSLGVHDAYWDLVSRLAASERSSEREADAPGPPSKLAFAWTRNLKPVLALLARDPELTKIQSSI
jgi:hypothetical protein